MLRDKSQSRKYRKKDTYPRPPKPPSYHKQSEDWQKHEINVNDYSNFEDLDKGGGKDSKKEEFYRKVRKMDPRKGNELPYQTLHPDDGSKQAGYKGGNTQIITHNTYLSFINVLENVSL